MRTSIRIAIAAMAVAAVFATHAQPGSPSGTVLWSALPAPTEEGPQANINWQFAQGAPSGSVLWFMPTDLGDGVEWFSQQMAQGGALAHAQPQGSLSIGISWSVSEDSNDLLVPCFSTGRDGHTSWHVVQSGGPSGTVLWFNVPSNMEQDVEGPQWFSS